jgi:DNA ligase-1
MTKSEESYISTGALYDAVLALRALRGSNAKKAFIENFRKTEAGKRSLDWLYNIAYDYNKMFGVVNIKFKGEPIYDDYTTSIEEVQSQLLDSLLNKTLTKPRLEAVIIASKFGPKTRELIRTILKKDPKTGLQDEAYNKLVGYECCPQFNVQLASSGGKTFEAMLSAILKLLAVKKRLLVSGKYDGVRVIGYNDGLMRTRNGHDVSVNYPDISEALQTLRTSMRELDKGYGYAGGEAKIILDGELYDVVGGASNIVMTQMFRKKEVDTGGGRLKYMIFDCMTVEDWKNKTCHPRHPLQFRLDFLKLLEKKLPDLFTGAGPFRVVPHIVVTTEQEIRDAFAQAISEGLEGLVVKDAYSTYNYKRDKTWYKLKNRETDTLTIIGFNPGEAGKKYENTLGAMVLANPDGSPAGNCGYGLTDELRDEIWQNQSKYMGVKVDIYYDTKLESEQGLMRHPSFQGFRWDLTEK